MAKIVISFVGLMFINTFRYWHTIEQFFVVSSSSSFAFVQMSQTINWILFGLLIECTIKYFFMTFNRFTYAHSRSYKRLKTRFSNKNCIFSLRLKTFSKIKRLKNNNKNWSLYAVRVASFDRYQNHTGNTFEIVA